MIERLSRLRVGGIASFSTVDFPERLAAVLFCQGCSWRCAYCHNPHLLPRCGERELPWSGIETFLQSRRGLLDAVVFSGGEPTLQADIETAVRRVRALGFQVGLHTAGIYPARLVRLLPWIDWVGMDFKAPPAAYERITGVPDSGERVMESVRRVLESGVAYEFRMTVHPMLLTPDEILEAARVLAGLGARRFALQFFRAQGCLDTVLCAAGIGVFPDTALQDRLQRLFPYFTVRAVQGEWS